MTFTGNIFGGQPPSQWPVAKSGQIYQGSGQPSPSAGKMGSLYINIDTGDVYQKRRSGTVANWGNPLYAVPLALALVMKFFGDCEPNQDLGVVGDYYIRDIGAQRPTLHGPKATETWVVDAPNTAAIVLDGTYNKVPE